MQSVAMFKETLVSQYGNERQSQSAISLQLKDTKKSLLLFRNIIRIQPSGNQLSLVPKEMHRELVAQNESGCLQCVGNLSAFINEKALIYKPV